MGSLHEDARFGRAGGLCPPARFSASETGSVFTTLLVAVAAVGAVSYSVFQVMSGPVALMTKSVRKSDTDGQMLSNARILIANATATSTAAADCDSDNFVELPAMASASGDRPLLRDVGGFVGTGGLLPDNLGLRKTDAWGTRYGYCAWDLGGKNDPAVNNGCGAGALRLGGASATALPTAPAGVQIAMALVSAGPNRKFETTCKTYNYATTAAPAGDASNQMISRSTGSDDVVLSYTYDAASRLFAPAWVTTPLAPETAGVRNVTKNIEVGEASGEFADTSANPEAGDVTSFDNRLGVVRALSLSSAGVLSAGGGLQLADENAPISCPVGAPSVAAGTLRYNVLDEVVEYCDNAGGGWTWAGNPTAEGDTDSNGISMLKDGVAKTNSPYIVGLGQGALCLYNATGGEYGGCTAGTATGLRNTAIGQEAGAAITTGFNNTILGYRALAATTTGGNNTALGTQVLTTNISGGNNTAVGAFALFSSTASDNTALGWRALGANTSGAGNTGVGYMALGSNTTAGQNTAAGYRALGYNLTGSPNTAIGIQALGSNVTGTQNTAVGHKALSAAVAPTAATAVGHQALGDSLSGTNSVAVGYAALKKNITGTDNTAIGYRAAAAPVTTSGSQNVAVGYGALEVSESSGMVALGYRALGAAVGGGTSVAIGDSAMGAETAPSASVAIGYQAMGSSQGAFRTVAVGYQTAQNGTAAATDNVAVGYQALQSNQGDSGLTAFGYRAMREHIGGASVRGTAFGYRALEKLQNIGAYDDETAFGYLASAALLSSGRNLSVGYRALSSIASTSLAVAVGSGAAQTLTSQSTPLIAFGYNAQKDQTQNAGIAIGSRALETATGAATACTAIGYQAAGSQNCDSSSFFFGSQAGGFGEFYGNPSRAFGYQALAWNTGGTANVALGWRALSNAGFGGQDNTALGAESLKNTTTGARNTGLGAQTLIANTSGTENAAAGHKALSSNTTGDQNTAVGYEALTANTTGVQNIAIGYQALLANTTGSYNSAVGYQAMVSNTTGSQNTAIGYQAGPFASSSNSVTCLGYQACQAFSLASNMVMLGNGAITTVYGQPAWTSFSDRRLKTDISDSDLGLSFVMRLRPVSYRRIDGNGRLNYGFVAQEVEELIGGRKTNLVSVMEDERKTRFMDLSSFIAPVVKAVQEQRAHQAERQDQIDRMKEDLSALTARIEYLSDPAREEAR